MVGKNFSHFPKIWSLFTDLFFTAKVLQSLKVKGFALKKYQHELKKMLWISCASYLGKNIWEEVTPQLCTEHRSVIGVSFSPICNLTMCILAYTRMFRWRLSVRLLLITQLSHCNLHDLTVILRLRWTNSISDVLSQVCRILKRNFCIFASYVINILISWFEWMWYSFYSRIWLE